MKDANEIKGGLWPRTSKNGLQYWNGSIEIDGQKYWVSLFDNHGKSTNPKAPAYNMLLKPADEAAPYAQTRTYTQSEAHTTTPPAPYAQTRTYTQSEAHTTTPPAQSADDDQIPF